MYSVLENLTKLDVSVSTFLLEMIRYTFHGFPSSPNQIILLNSIYCSANHSWEILYFLKIFELQSVSRTHGVFRVENREEISQFKSKVIYEDFGSTYGSYVGDAAIASSQVLVSTDISAWTVFGIQATLFHKYTDVLTGFRNWPTIAEGQT